MKSALRNTLDNINLQTLSRTLREIGPYVRHICPIALLFETIAGNGILKNISGKDRVFRRSKFVAQVQRNLVHNLVVC